MNSATGALDARRVWRAFRRSNPGLEGGTLLHPLAGIGHSLYRAVPGFLSTYSRKLTVGVERKLDPDATITAEYSNVRGIHLPRTRNAAVGLPPDYDLEQTARSAYQGLALALNRRLSKELTYLVSYNLGRTHDDASDYDEQPLNPLNLRQDWALSRQHQVTGRQSVLAMLKARITCSASTRNGRSPASSCTTVPRSKRLYPFFSANYAGADSRDHGPYPDFALIGPVVPEPAPVALSAVGLIFLAGLYRRISAHRRCC